MRECIRAHKKQMKYSYEKNARKDKTWKDIVKDRTDLSSASTTFTSAGLYAYSFLQKVSGGMYKAPCKILAEDSLYFIIF